MGSGICPHHAPTFISIINIFCPIRSWVRALICCGGKTRVRFFWLFYIAYSQIHCITLRVSQTSKEFWVFLFCQNLSGPLRKQIITCDWCISIHFVCFCLSRFVACDRPVSGNGRPVFFKYFFWSFLFLSLERIKQYVPPALYKNTTHHHNFLRYPLAVYSHSQFCFCWPSWASALHCDQH